MWLSQGVSEADAPPFIAEQQTDRHGAKHQLELDARKGLDAPRAKIHALAKDLEMSFREVNLSVGVPGVPTIEVPVQLRSLRGAARWHFRHMTVAHCTPRVVRDEKGERLYADPLTCDWAHQQSGSVKALDPDGVVLPLGIASDGTELSPEQSAEPVYIINNALPLHERA